MPLPTPSLPRSHDGFLGDSTEIGSRWSGGVVHSGPTWRPGPRLLDKNGGMTNEPNPGASAEWKVFGERRIYENRWVNLDLVDVESPDGSRFEHQVVRTQ